jgi:TolB protein
VFDAGYPVHFAPPPEIWVINVDGTGNTFLTRDGHDPDWSPDGSRIAFSAGGINIMNADGSGRISITNGESDSSPSWSPDSRRIAFARGGKIYVVGADGSDLVQLASGPYDYQPVWSPDGSKIAFGRSDVSATNYGLYVMNVDGSAPTLVADKGVQPDWQAIPSPPGPQPGDYDRPRQFCKAERRFLGKKAFRQKYGRQALRNCVRQNTA